MLTFAKFVTVMCLLLTVLVFWSVYFHPSANAGIAETRSRLLELLFCVILLSVDVTLIWLIQSVQSV